MNTKQEMETKHTDSLTVKGRKQAGAEAETTEEHLITGLFLQLVQPAIYSLGPLARG